MNVSEETVDNLLTPEIIHLCQKLQQKGVDEEIFYVNLLKHAVCNLKDKMFTEIEILNFVGSAFIKHSPNN